MDAIGELMDTVRSAGGTAMVVAIVAAFVTMAAMLWVWGRRLPPE